MIDECGKEEYIGNLDKVKNFFKKEETLLPTMFRSDSEARFEELAKIIKKVGDDANLLIIYGVGLGLFYEAAKKWLKADKTRRVVFLEDSSEAFLNFLRSSLAREILNTSRAKVIFLDEEDLLLKKMVWENVMLKAEVLAHPLYLKNKHQRFAELKEKITYQIYAANLLVGDYSDFGELHLRNTFKNLLSSKEFCLSESFKGKFKGVPAVICGGGSSVLKNISFIKELQDRALIISGGAGINILANNGLEPHLAVNVDKTAPHERFEKIKHLEMPHFVQLQISHENYLTLSSKKILLPPYGSYPLETFIYEVLGLAQESFELGWTVGSAMVAIAFYMGCDPIVFTGLDFCYEKEKYPQDIPKGRQVDVVETTDLFGNRAYTQKDFILAKEWLEYFAKENKQQSIINANEGGLPIKGILRKSFKELSEEESVKIDRCRIKDQMERLMTGAIALEEGRVGEVLFRIKKSAKNSLALCDAMISNIEELCKSSNFSFKEFESEIFYSLHLLPLWNIFSYVISRDVINQKKAVDKDLAIFMNRVIFYKNVSETFLRLFESL